MRLGGVGKSALTIMYIQSYFVSTTSRFWYFSNP